VFILAGDGPEMNELRAFVHSLGLDATVSLVGYLEGDQLAAEYESSDVFLLPTYHPEGFPTVLGEAMGVGLPIITTRTRGAADHLEDLVNALFVPARRPDCIARALEQLIDKPLTMRRMSDANLAKADEFGAEKVAGCYVSIIEGTLRNCRARAVSGD